MPSKAIGIDYGRKRIGIAISDSSSIIASPLCTISNQEIFKFLDDLFKDEDVNCIVVGEAKNLDGGETDSSIPIERFLQKVTQAYAREMLVETVQEKGYTVVSEQKSVDNTIELVVEKW